MQKRYNEYRKLGKPIHHHLHAEMDAILRIIHQLDGIKNAKVFVYRETKDGKMAMARPCPACMAALVDHGVREIYYSTECGYAYEYITKKEF